MGTGAEIRVEELSRRYGDLAALDGVSLTVEPGEWVAVTGPSGSGKTTLLNILAGLDRPTAGRVVVGDTDLGALGRRQLARYRRHQVGLIFQQFHLMPYLTALENVLLAQYVHSMTDATEAEQALTRIGLGERLHHLPRQLSGGEQQRVCIARALINHPPIVLADEPTGNLDGASEEVVMALLEDLHRRGHTLILVTHAPRLAARADRQIHLEHGRLADPAQEVDATDPHLLVELWRRLEEDGRAVSVGYPGVADALAEGLLRFTGRDLAFTPRGRAEAAAAVRRARLAEVLLARSLERDPTPECGRAIPLAPATVDSVSAFLDHPTTCPHGRPIPPPPP